MKENGESRAGRHIFQLIFRVAILGTMLSVLGCRENSTDLVSAIAGHAILIVRFSDSPEQDKVLLENVLRKGGSITCGNDSKYTAFLRNYDREFDMAAATDRDGSFLITPTILNWISSKGWKFQQKFCINLNHDNAEYYFVK